MRSRSANAVSAHLSFQSSVRTLLPTRARVDPNLTTVMVAMLLVGGTSSSCKTVSRHASGLPLSSSATNRPAADAEIKKPQEDKHAAIDAHYASAYLCL